MKKAGINSTFTGSGTVCTEWRRKDRNRNISYTCLQLHDAGKFSTEFQAYIKQEDDLPKRGAVNHSSAGAELLMQEFKNSPYHSVQDMRLLIELISYTITAHHGIYDCIDEDGEDKFEVRLNVVEKKTGWNCKTVVWRNAFTKICYAVRWERHMVNS